MGARCLVVIGVFGSWGCLGTFASLPGQTRRIELTELHFGNARATQLQPGSDPRASEPGVTSPGDPSNDVRSGTLLVATEADDLLAARKSGSDDTLRLNLRYSTGRRSSRTKRLSFSTPWTNIREIRERIRYENPDALAVFLGGLMVGVASAPVFIISRSEADPAGASYRAIGGCVLATGILMAIIGGAYGLRPDDVKTVWPVPQLR